MIFQILTLYPAHLFMSVNAFLELNFNDCVVFLWMHIS